MSCHNNHVWRLGDAFAQTANPNTMGSFESLRANPCAGTKIVSPQLRRSQWLDFIKLYNIDELYIDDDDDHDDISWRTKYLKWLLGKKGIERAIIKASPCSNTPSKHANNPSYVQASSVQARHNGVRRYHHQRRTTW